MINEICVISASPDLLILSGMTLKLYHFVIEIATGNYLSKNVSPFPPTTDNRKFSAAIRQFSHRADENVPVYSIRLNLVIKECKAFVIQLLRNTQSYFVVICFLMSCSHTQNVAFILLRKKQIPSCRMRSPCLQLCIRSIASVSLCCFISTYLSHSLYVLLVKECLFFLWFALTSYVPQVL